MAELPSFSLERAIEREPPVTTPDASIHDALTTMQTADSSYVVVSGPDGSFVSLITERDLVDIIAAQHYSSKTPLSEVMPATVITAHIDQIPDVITARMLLQHHRIRHLPLTNTQGQIVGMITHDRLSHLLNPVDLLRLRPVNEVMTVQVIWALPDATFINLSNLMSCHRVSCVVISEDTPQRDRLRPIGLVTERDIVRLWFQADDISNKRARDIMSAPLRCILPHETVWQAHDLMRNFGIRRLVVVDPEGFLAGILTQTSLLQATNPTEAHLTLQTLVHIINNHTADLDQANQQLQRSVQERKRAKLALQHQLKRERLVSRITQNIHQSLDLETILTNVVTNVSEFLQADRTLIYRIDNENNSDRRIIAEAVAKGHHKVQGNKALEEILWRLDPQFYVSGRVHSVPDLQVGDRSSQKAGFLRYLGIRATLLAPIRVHNSLWGLLILNQQTPRRWDKSEINLIEQITAQLGVAISQSILYAQLSIANQTLEQQANLDELTQISNRRRFDTIFQKEWRRHQREQQPLSIVLCDVDHFKLYNDRYGHQAGDQCLRAIAQALKQSIRRPGDEVSRYGGEEFIAILPNTPLVGACHVAEAMRLKVIALHIAHESSNTEPWVTLSLGVASCIPTDQQSPHSLIEAADIALYQGKHNGRNQWAA